MAVMEAMMVLYSKEVATGDRVEAAIQRFCHHGHGRAAQADPHAGLSQLEPEQALLAWLNEAVAALHHKILQERERPPKSVSTPKKPSLKPLTVSI